MNPTRHQQLSWTLAQARLGAPNAPRHDEHAQAGAMHTNPFVPANNEAAWRHLRHLLGILLACTLLLGFVTAPANAQSASNACWYTNGQAGTVTFNSGTTNTGSTGNTINLTPGTPVGTVLWTSNTAAVPNPPTMQCNGNAVPSGIANSIAGPPTSGNTLFPTGIPGISYELLHPNASTLLASYPNYPIGSGIFSVETNVELIYTGPYLPPAGTYSLTGPLSQWNVDTCSRNKCNGKQNTVSAEPVEYFNIAVTISVVVPTCNVQGSVNGSQVNFTVTLPNVTTTQLDADPTPGITPFTLPLVNCPAGEKVLVNLDTTNAYTSGGVNGVIAPSGAGYATGVGVQILQSDGSTPVTFGSTSAEAINAGTTTSSTYNIKLFARYYRTSTPVSAGPVQGIATYTINYQ